MNWDDFRYFLAVARAGTLSGAARMLKTTQPTMGRRVHAFERRVGARLFERTPGGLVLTAAGKDILKHIETMETEAIAAERQIKGRDDGLSGSVRVTSTESFGNAIVAPILADLVLAYPGLRIALLTDGRHLSLIRHEADLALRLTPFKEKEILRRKIATVSFGLYGAHSYLKRFGAPDIGNGLEGHIIVCIAVDGLAIADSTWLRRFAHGARVGIRSNSRDAAAKAAVSGSGLAILPHYLGDAIPGLVRLDVQQAPPSRGVWLGMHPSMKDVPRVSAVADALAAGITKAGL